MIAVYKVCRIKLMFAMLGVWLRSDNPSWLLPSTLLSSLDLILSPNSSLRGFYRDPITEPRQPRQSRRVRRILRNPSLGPN